MAYLFLEIWFLLLIAFGLGMLVQYWFCCRSHSKDQTDSSNAINDSVIDHDNSNYADPAGQPESVNEVEQEPTLSVADQWKPLALSSPPEILDDLKRIKGIGSVIEKTLHELGIYQFKQIADWSSDNVAWVESFLSFQGRIDREGWIAQAKTLASGSDTEFAKRVDDGQVDY